MSEHYLKAIFDPSSVAVIGASETEYTQAALITEKLHREFTGKLFFVNPKHKTILDETCYKHVTDVKESVDLAVIISPTHTVMSIVHQCAEQGIKNIAIMSKFSSKYRGEVTQEMKSLREVAQDLDVRFMGPNVSALVRPSSKFNLSTTNNKILPGKLALVSRSSSVCNTVIDWAEFEQIGFSSIISHGIAVDIGLADILDFLASDYRTNGIILYINHIRNSRRFMSALRAAAKLKPVIVLKSARENGTYSDVLTKIDNVHVMHDTFLAAVLRAGADNVSSLSHLFAAAKILSSNQRTNGKRLGIISNGYGPVMLANDRLRALGFETITFSPELVEKLKGTSSSSFSFDNAIVMPDSEDVEQLYVKGTQSLLASKEVDAIAIFLAPCAMTDPRQ